MKQGTVKYSQEFISPTGLKRWVGIEYPIDFDTEEPFEALEQARTIVQSWYDSRNPPVELDLGYGKQPVKWSDAPLPTINREHQRLIDRIDDADNFDALYELEKNAKNSDNQFVIGAWNNKYNQLLTKT